MRFEVIAAFIIGILLPLLETGRRGIGHWTINFTTMFEDYLAGALLLIGAWAAYRERPLGTCFSPGGLGLIFRVNEQQFLVSA